jgi:hypothetical protein
VKRGLLSIAATALVAAAVAGAANAFRVFPTPPVNGQLSGIGFVSPTDGWVVGGHPSDAPDDGGAATLTEHWNGSTWSVVPSFDTLRVDDTLAAVAGVASNDVWAVGQRKPTGQKSPVVTLALHWNGSAWSAVSTPSVSATRASLTDVAALASNNVWAVGTTITGTLVEHWNGSAWSVVPSPNAAGSSTNSLTGISAVAPNDIWAVGSSTSVVGVNTVQSTLVEHWNGSAWTIVPSPNVPPQRTGVVVRDLLTSVTAVNSSDVWAAGYSIDVASGSGQPNKSVIEHWNGSTWTIVPSPSPQGHNTLTGISAISASDIWAVGYGSNDVSTGIPIDRPELLHWNGTAWTSVTAPPNVGTSDNLLLGVATTGGTVWAAGWAGDVGTLILQGP